MKKPTSERCGVSPQNLFSPFFACCRRHQAKNRSRETQSLDF